MFDYNARSKATEKREARKRMKSLLKFGSILIITFLLGNVLDTYVVSTFSIPSESMNDTLQVNDRIAVNKLVPGVTPLQRGDVIVFQDPSNWLSAAEKPDGTGYLVKRVIAVGGDAISCCDAAGHLLLNGKPLIETYIKPGDVPSQITFNEKVPAGTVWVMGDNRSNSKDSRYEGDSKTGKFVPVKDIVGRAFLIVWPFDRFNFI